MISAFLRKSFTRFSAITILGALLAACAGAPQPEAIPSPLQPSVAPGAGFTQP